MKSLLQPNLTSEYLHLGCGLNAPENWLNVDGSLQVSFAHKPRLKRLLLKVGLYPKHQAEIPWSSNILRLDLRKPLPFKDNQFVAVYSSHTLEHLFRNEALNLAKECFRVLKPGGVCRIVVPDLAAAVQRYTEAAQSNSVLAADQFMDELIVHPREPERGLLGWLHTVLGYHQHKWMYDATSLKELLINAGFSHVTNSSHHEGRLLDLERIENPSRIKDGAGVVAEGIKL